MHSLAIRPQKIAFYLLILISLSSVVDLFILNFWEIIRLAFISLGLAFLMWRTRFQVGPVSSRDTFLFWVVYVFILAQFPGKEVKDLSEAAFPVARSTVLGAGFVLLLFGGRQVALLSKQDKWILGISVFVGLSIVGSQWGGRNTRGSFEGWRDLWVIFQVVLAYFFMTRFFRSDRTGVHSKRLLIANFLIFGVISGTGIYQVLSTTYHFCQALRDFRSGEFARVRRYASDFSPLFSRLEFETLSVGHLLDVMSAEAAAKTWEAGDYATIGEIAEKNSYRQVAYAAFNEVYEREPTYPAIHAKLGRVQMKLGNPARGLDILQKGIEQEEVEAEDFLSLAWILCKVGRWEDASEALDLAVEKSEMQEKRAGIFPKEKVMLKAKLGELLPGEFLPFLEEFSPFEVVRLLQLRGWVVLFPPMEIGKTGITTPVDIEVWSEQQVYGRREAIIVNGKQVSNKGWGRNIVVLDSESGKIELIASLGVNGLPGRKSTVIADFLKAIPQGKIVAGTILDTGGGAPSAEDIEELTDLGTRGFPGNYIAQAFIGVKGAGKGTAFELMGNPFVGGGVLAGNVHRDLHDDPRELESSLQDAAARAPGKLALYIPRFDRDAEISIYRH